MNQSRSRNIAISNVLPYLSSLIRSQHFVCEICFYILVSFFLCGYFNSFSWVFGEFLCKMYQFVHALSYTASIFILMVICMERYFAIIYPITCKQILTTTRLRVSTLIYFTYIDPMVLSVVFIDMPYRIFWMQTNVDAS